MIYRFILLFTALSLIYMSSCTDDNIDSAIEGNIEYGEVDCSLDQTFWNYEPYQGMVYIIPKDSLDYSNLYNLSDSVYTSDGNFTIGVEPGYYYVFIKEHTSFDEYNEVKVNLNDKSEVDLRFHNCK